MLIKIRRLVLKLKQIFYTKLVKLKVAQYGYPLKVNNKSLVTKNTYLGNNNNFNGMKICGMGKVIIGNNFHSGIDCLMLTSNHNYEGDAIPYDNSYISKNINIKDNVWIGSRVIILGGVEIGEGAIIQAG